MWIWALLRKCTLEITFIHISFSLQSTFRLSPAHEWKDLSTYRDTGFYEWRNSGIFASCNWGNWQGFWAFFFYRFREKLQKLCHQDGIGNGKFICKRSLSFREGLSIQSLGSWVCQAALSLLMSHSKTSPLFCYNTNTTEQQWKTTQPPFVLSILRALRDTHTEAHIHTHPLTSIHSIQFPLPSRPTWSCSQLIEANKCMVSFSLKRKLSGFTLDEVTSILVYLIPSLQKLSPSKLMVLFREECLSQTIYLIELVTFFQRTILPQEMLFHWNWKFSVNTLIFVVFDRKIQMLRIKMEHWAFLLDFVLMLQSCSISICACFKTYFLNNAILFLIFQYYILMCWDCQTELFWHYWNEIFSNSVLDV